MPQDKDMFENLARKWQHEYFKMERDRDMWKARVSGSPGSSEPVPVPVLELEKKEENTWSQRLNQTRPGTGTPKND